MTEEAISYIMQKMSEWLDNNQMIRLEKTLEEVLRNEEVIPIKSSQELLEEFLSVKKLEGRSEKTLFLYRFNIEKVLAKSDKNVCAMNADDIRQYLSKYQETNGVSKATIDNVRRNLSSFFRWLEEENLIYKSPLRRIHRIKLTSVVRETYGDEELERMRDDCEQIRNLAIIDLLNSTGMRVGELVNLDIGDMDFAERECVVLGKGDKERIVYFDARTKIHLEKYLKTRDDENPALFVAIRRPHRRLKAGGVEIMLRKMG